MGVSSEVSRLKELAKSGHVDRWEILWLHQHISERIMAASLQVDATIAQIDNEIQPRTRCMDIFQTVVTGR